MAHVEDRRWTRDADTGDRTRTDYNGPSPWRARYRTPDGRARSKSFPRKVDAERFLTSIEGHKLKGDYVDPMLGKVRFAEYADQWLETKANLRPRSKINVEGRLRNHIKPAFASIPLAQIRPADVRSWVAELSTKRSPATVKATYLVLSQILRTAEIDGLIGRTPCIGIELPRDHNHQEMVFLDASQVRVLAEAITDRYRALIYAAAYTGLRAGELSALRVDRLNLLRGTVEVTESASEVRGVWMVGPTKTGARRTLTLPRFLCEMLGEHIGRFPGRDGLVFTAAKGGPLRHHNFYLRHFKPAVERAELPEALRFHDLRHTCASLLIAQGAHAKEIQERLGHSTIRLTFDRYGHLLPSLDERLRDGLDATFESARVAHAGASNGSRTVSAT